MTQPDPSALSGAPDPNAPSGTTVGDGTTATPPETGTPSGTTTEPVAPATVSRDDFDRTVNQLRAADQKRAAAEAALQQLRDKDLPEMDKLRRDAEQFKAENDRLKKQMQGLAVETAFLRDNTVKWKDGSAALKLADMSKITVEEDGTVTGIKIAMEALAKQYPWMVDDGKPEPGATPPAGAPPMNGGTTSNKPDTKGLAQRIPAFASRRRPTRST